MFRKYFIILISIACIIRLPAQQITGRVLEKDEKGKKVALESAGVFLVHAKKGILTNTKGEFILPFIQGDTVVARHPSYKDDTLIITGNDYIEFVLTEPRETESVLIEARVLPTYIEVFNPIQTEFIGEDELGKAACCNLSESFTTNGSVEVNESDAVTGSKEIKMLGLAGKYVQISLEKKPTIRGLGYLYGLNWIPGPWISSIQVSKGPGSVVDGYESMTGEINVELKKPQAMKRFYFNAYGSTFGRGEVNLASGIKLSPKWSTAILASGSYNQKRIDHNNDGFMNLPLIKMLTAMNRWQYEYKGWCIQFGAKGTYEERIGGQMNFKPESDKGTTNAYGFGMNTKRLDAWGKLGYTWKGKPYRSLGSIYSAVIHDQSAYFGLVNYSGKQNYFRTNLIYEDIIGDTRYKYKAGMSYVLDDYSEKLDSFPLARTESVPGAFGEFTWEPVEKFKFVAGLRGDYNNLYGFKAIPRMHFRYEPVKGTTFRVSIGKGYRTPNVIAENIPFFTNSRQVFFTEKLRQESSWTFGLNVVQNFVLNNRDGSISIDGYRTNFENQIITDLETYNRVSFYNLKGKSFSSVIQLEINYELLKGLDIKAAFRWQDVRSTIDSTLRIVPFNPRVRGMVNLSWESRKEKIQLDGTVQFTGIQRLPGIESNPDAHHFGTESPAFFQYNAQATYRFKDVEIYAGGENLGNFTQHFPIISPTNPFGPNFDASMVWGPIMGRMIYAGIRFAID